MLSYEILEQMNQLGIDEVNESEVDEDYEAKQLHEFLNIDEL